MRFLLFSSLLTQLTIFIILITPNQACDCLNNGHCSLEQRYSRCICPSPYIGQKCHIKSQQLSKKPIQLSISTDFTYFYFQPSQQNYYQLTFMICMNRNYKNSYSYFFYQIQRDDGSIQMSPSIFQTAKFRLNNNNCTNFTTHYVNIKKRQDDTYKKIIVGLKTMSQQQAQKYSYFNYLINPQEKQNQQKKSIKTQNLIKQQNNKNTKGQQDQQTRYDKQQKSNQKTGNKDKSSTTSQKLKQQTNNQQNYQIISIKVLHQVYIKNQYSNTFIIIFTSASLLLILLSFAIYLNNKYRSRSIDIQYHFQSNTTLDLARTINPQQIREKLKLNNFNHIDIFMPTTLYRHSNTTFQSPTTTMTDIQTHRQQDQDCCSICLQQFEDMDEIRKTPCSHSYHRQCIDNWLQTQMSCPVCRRKIDFSKEIRRLQYQILCRQLLK